MSCVVDTAPKFHAQVERFAASLLASDPGREAKLVVNHIGRLPDATTRRLQAAGAILNPIHSYGDGPAAYCNKLQQFDYLLGVDSTHVLLCDADIMFVQALDCLPMVDAVCARIVGAPNPPEPVLRALLDSAGFGDEALTSQPEFRRDGRTHRLNCNGGMYLMPRETLARLAPVWRKWSSYCLGRPDILGGSLHHSDQLGFMLAMIEIGLPFESLPAHANYPTHLPAARYHGIPDQLTSIHYHDHLEPAGRLRRVGVTAIDAWVDKANDMLVHAKLVDPHPTGLG